MKAIHLVAIVLVALVVFGTEQLPQLGRWPGRTFSKSRKGARDMADGFKEEAGQQNAVGPKGSRTRRRGAHHHPFQLIPVSP